MALFPLVEKKNILYAVTAFVASMTVYMLTLCPTVYIGDSGEFITNAATLGINHPTGYTLYTLLARITMLSASFWTPAYAVNFFSALCAALTVVTLYFVGTLFTKQKEIALIFSLVFGFSYTFWSRSSIAEVYTLNAFFVALSFYFLLRWYFSQRTLDLLILSYVVGLGLSQHVTGAIVAPFIAVLIVMKQPRILLDIKILAALLLFAVVGFSTYLYLPIRTAADPPIDWGNPGTIENILGHFFPKGGDKLFGEVTTSGGFGARISWVFSHVLAKEFWYFGGLSALGLLALGRKHWRLVLFFLMVTGFNTYFTIVRKLPFHADFDAYFIPTFMVMGILLCIAANWGWQILSERWPADMPMAVRTALMLALLIPPALLLKVHYYENDKSNNWFGYDFGKNVLATVPDNALLITVGDEQSFLTWYFKYVEHEREDVVSLDRALLGAVWGASHMYNRYLNLDIDEKLPQLVIAQQLVSEVDGKRPIAFSPRIPWDFVLNQYDFKHAGMTIEIVPKGSPAPEYTPTTFTLHPDWENQYFDERMKLMVKFYYKEYIDNARYWYSLGKREGAENELALFHAFPYRHKEREDVRTAFLLQAQLASERFELAEAMAFADSAEAYGTTDFRVHEMKGNISYLMQDSAGAVKHWRTALAYDPNNEKLQRNLDILTKPRQLPPRRSDPRRNSRRGNFPPRRNQQ